MNNQVQTTSVNVPPALRSFAPAINASEHNCRRASYSGALAFVIGVAATVLTSCTIPQDSNSDYRAKMYAASVIPSVALTALVSWYWQGGYVETPENERIALNASMAFRNQAHEAMTTSLMP